jgi:hypothetical protein
VVGRYISQTEPSGRKGYSVSKERSRGQGSFKKNQSPASIFVKIAFASGGGLVNDVVVLKGRRRDLGRSVCKPLNAMF